MRLYVHRLSANALRAMITARHCGLDVELVDIDLGGREQRSDAYLSINPNGRVPALVDGDFTLWESNAIMQYLAGVAGEKLLWPDDARARADIARWQFWDVAQLGPAVRPFYREYLFKAMLGRGDPDPDIISAAEGPLRACAEVLEVTLSSRPYLTGSTLTLADISLVTTLIYAEPARLPLEEFEAIRRWRGNVSSIPAFSVVRPSTDLAA